jgi:hypothetical protein
MLDVFDPATLEGNIGYILASNNNEALAKATWDSNIPVILTHASNLTGQPRVIQVAEIYHLTLGLTVYVSNGAGSFNSGTTITAIDEQYKRITVSTDVKEPLANATIYAINPTASLTLNPASIAGEIKEGYQVECTTDPVFILDIEKTDLNTGYLTSLGFTTKLKVNMPITFSGTSFGNIITDIIYYVRSVVDSKNFTISDSLDGPIYSVTTGTGLLSVSTPSSKIPADAVVTGWNPETNILSIKWDSPNTVSMTKSGQLRMGSVSRLPPGMILDSLSGEIYGSVPSQSAITINYKFTVIALRYSVDPTVPNVSSYRTFSVDIMGEIDSVIHFTTSGDLGSIDANFISNLNVNAITTIPDAVLTYKLISGKIPPGISLVNDGTLQGKVNQFSDGIIYKAIWKSNRSYTLNNVVTHLGKKYKCTTIHTSSNNFNSAYWITYVCFVVTA